LSKAKKVGDNLVRFTLKKTTKAEVDEQGTLMSYCCSFRASHATKRNLRIT